MRNAALAALCVILGFTAWISGALDRPLSDVGLNKNDCAENLFGQKVCGDDLVEWCRERYDPDINDDVCRPVLEEAGEDPDAIVEARGERERLAAETRRADARTTVRIGDTATDDGVAYRVRHVRRVGPIQTAYGPPKVPRPGRAFISVVFTYTNDTGKPIDLLCSVTAGDAGFSLVDDAGREFSPDGTVAMELPANEEACAGNVQPGDRENGQIVFDVRDDVSPAELVVWNPDGDGAPEDGGTHLVVPTPRL